MAMASIRADARAPILNLRSVNHYVAGSWEEWTGQMKLQNAAARQPSPGPLSLRQTVSSAGAHWPYVFTLIPHVSLF